MGIQRFAVSLLKNGLLLLALAATAGGSALVTMRSVLSSQEVQVPSLLSQRLVDASALLARQQLVVKLEGRRHDSRVPAGRIVAQEPLPGSTLKSHRSVRVWLSAGPQRIRVPALEGQSLRTARLTVEQTGLALERVVEVDDAAAEGTVLVQRPPAGETDELKGGLALLVSRGPAHLDYVMPDLIGRPADAVIDGLRRAGLKVSDIRYRSYPGVAPGIVLRQSPAAGQRVNGRNAVTLDVNRIS